jgi:hypothetical protein
MALDLVAGVLALSSAIYFVHEGNMDAAFWAGLCLFWIINAAVSAVTADLRA